MLDYMDYVQRVFFQSTQWNEDNSYASVVDTSANIIDFDIPQSVSLKLSSQPSLNSFTSYTLSNLGLVNGSIAYLYSSRPLLDIATSANIPLSHVVSGYKILEPVSFPSSPSEYDLYYQKWHAGKRIDRSPTLLYGRLYLPANSLEAMLIRRMSSKSQILLTCVSDSTIKHGGALTFNYQRDNGRWCHEFIYSTYEALLGLRGMYSFGFAEIRSAPKSTTSTTNSTRTKTSTPLRVPSRLSLGFEVFYGVSNKSPGLSTALRYTTQSTYTDSPLTLTLMSNPLMGHFSATYAVRTTTMASFASRFDFNIFSYDSDLSIGCELWRNRGKDSKGREKSDSRSKRNNASKDRNLDDDQVYPSVFKSSMSLGSQNLKLLWETRFKDFLVSAGIILSLAGRAPVASSFGVEIQYSS